jgi:hypothetical protein
MLGEQPDSRFYNVLQEISDMNDKMKTNANHIQIGGDHYKATKPGQQEHWDIVATHGLDYFQGQITRYVMRWKKKAGLQDLKKGLHTLQKYVELVEAGIIPDPTIKVTDEKDSYPTADGTQHSLGGGQGGPYQHRPNPNLYRDTQQRRTRGMPDVERQMGIPFCGDASPSSASLQPGSPEMGPVVFGNQAGQGRYAEGRPVAPSDGHKSYPDPTSYDTTRDHPAYDRDRDNPLPKYDR